MLQQRPSAEPLPESIGAHAGLGRRHRIHLGGVDKADVVLHRPFQSWAWASALRILTPVMVPTEGTETFDWREKRTAFASVAKREIAQFSEALCTLLNDRTTSGHVLLAEFLER